MPLTTEGLQVLEKVVTLPPGVSSVRVVLTGFAPTDLRTRGSIVFDDDTTEFTYGNQGDEAILFQPFYDAYLPLVERATTGPQLAHATRAA